MDGLEQPPIVRRARFDAGGFFVMRGSARTHVFIDCGEVGMRGRGGHGHNDVLSFELMLDGLNVITDSGAYRLHGVTRVAEPVSQHRVPQRRPGR
jgi:hypothetical protein